MTPLERLLTRVDVDENGCWLFTGASGGTMGYGVLGRGSRDMGNVYAHRVAYEGIVGPVPAGLDLDHLCRVAKCCNPDHLEPVTHRENVLRGFGVSARHARQTHCVHGHEFDEANTYVDPRGRRNCRQCALSRQRERRGSRRA